MGFDSAFKGLNKRLGGPQADWTPWARGKSFTPAGSRMKFTWIFNS